MLEPLLRANVGRLQTFYDRCPAPARNVMTSARGWFLSQMRYSSATLRYLQSLKRNESWTAKQIRDFQLSAVRTTIDHARRFAPAYRRYPAIEIESLDDLRKLPVLPREIVRSQPELFLATDVPEHRRIRAGTTGTTGGNLKVAYTEELARANWAFLLRQWAWAGVEPLQPRVTLFGARIVPARRSEPPFWTYNIPERQILVSIFHLARKTARLYVEFLRQQNGKVLEGFPSVLGTLADFLLERGQTVPMQVAFTSGEPLYASTRAKIEAAFECRVFDSYGMTEYCGQIHECERGEMHLLPEYGYLEILDADDQPVAEGEEGNFAWTGFLNRAMPLIRYKIGDRGRWLSNEPCACGRAFPRVLPTITRESELLTCSDGRIFSPRALNQLLKHATALRFCQFVHERPDRVIVRVGAGGRNAMDEMMQIRTSLAAMLGDAIRVTAEMADEPIARPGGKVPFILNLVTP